MDYYNKTLAQECIAATLSPVSFAIGVAQESCSGKWCYMKRR